MTVAYHALLSNPQVGWHPAHFGSLTGTTTTTTATLKAFFDYIIANRVQGYLPKGTYTVNGAIATNQTVADGYLDLFSDDATITLDSGSTALEYFLIASSTALNSHRIGGRLTLNLNDKAQRGVVLTSNSGGTTAGAACLVEGVTVNDIYAPSGSNGIAYGVQIVGPFQETLVRDVRVDGASRHSSLDATGDCKGVTISGAVANVTLERPVVRNILNATQDADGIYVAGGLNGTVPRAQTVTITDATCVDCQGRSIKTQCQETVIIRPHFERQAVVSITNSVDVDAQYGSLMVDQPHLSYLLNGATSPLGSSHRPFVAQQLQTGDDTVTRILGGELHTEVAMSNLLFVNLDADTPNTTVIVDGMHVFPGSALTTTAFSRGLVEFDAADVEAMSNKVHFEIVNTRAPNTNRLLCYTGHTGADLSAKLSFNLCQNENTLTATSTSQAFAASSGTAITALDRYVVGINPGYSSLMASGWVADLQTDAFLPGNDIEVDLSTATVTGGPTALPSSGYARITCGGQGATSWVAQEIVIGDGSRRFYRLDPASTANWTEWGKPFLTGSKTHDFGSLADGAGETTTVTVTGAALGDYAETSLSVDIQGMTLTAWVSATNTVSVRLQNETGGTIDLASATLRAKVTPQ